MGKIWSRMTSMCMKFVLWIVVVLLANGAIPGPHAVIEALAEPRDFGDIRKIDEKLNHQGRRSLVTKTPELLSGQQPIVASLRDSTGAHLCSATLVAPKALLTAASCVTGGLKPSVHLGRLHQSDNDEFMLDSMQTIRTIIHPRYNDDSKDFDAALLVLGTPSTRPPLRLEDSQACFMGDESCSVLVMGWIKTFEEDLKLDKPQILTSNSVSLSNCRKQLVQWTRRRVSENMICAGGMSSNLDICQVDTGGPLILDDKIVGVASWSIGCTQEKRPGVFTSVPRILPWVRREVDSLQEDSDCVCAEDGISGGVSTGREGCKQHLMAYRDFEYFCMVHGGSKCSLAKESEHFKGAFWRLCE